MKTTYNDAARDAGQLTAGRTKNQIVIDPMSLARVTRAKDAAQELAEMGCRKLSSHDHVWVAQNGRVRAARAALKQHLTPGIVVSASRYDALTDVQKKLPTSYWA